MSGTPRPGGLNPGFVNSVGSMGPLRLAESHTTVRRIFLWFDGAAHAAVGEFACVA